MKLLTAFLEYTRDYRQDHVAKLALILLMIVFLTGLFLSYILIAMVVLAYQWLI